MLKLFSIDTETLIFHVKIHFINIPCFTGLATIGLIGATLTSLYLGLTLTEDELVDETLVYGESPSGMDNNELYLFRH